MIYLHDRLLWLHQVISHQSLVSFSFLPTLHPFPSHTNNVHFLSLCSSDLIPLDLLGAQRLGYHMPLTPLGPGQIVALYLSSNTVDFLRWSPQQLAFQVQATAKAQGQGLAYTDNIDVSSDVDNHFRNTTTGTSTSSTTSSSPLLQYTKRITYAAKRSIISSIRDYESLTLPLTAPGSLMPLLEVDVTDTASLFLDCVASVVR